VRAALFLAVTRDRPGTQHDVAALGDLCQALGFKVTLRMDPTAQVKGRSGPLVILRKKGSSFPRILGPPS
jgi:hypothetical protein